jgi:hypothetical protein
MGARDDETELRRVLRHFPDCAADVVALAECSDRFREMCAELADAERALDHVRTAPVPHQRERLEECNGWITRLTAEIREAIAVAKVVQLPPRPKATRP